MKSKVFLIFILIACVLFVIFRIRVKENKWLVNSNRLPLVKADRVLVVKAKREMYLINQGKIFRTYKVSLGKNPEGHKEKEGDYKTPEGKYVLDWRNDKSSCYKSIHVSYPNDLDRERARKNKVSPGGNIMIHGLHPSISWLGKFHTKTDWTWGCIAVTNDEMDEIWKSVKFGTPIEIQ